MEIISPPKEIIIDPVYKEEVLCYRGKWAKQEIEEVIKNEFNNLFMVNWCVGFNTLFGLGLQSYISKFNKFTNDLAELQNEQSELILLMAEDIISLKKEILKECERK